MSRRRARKKKDRQEIAEVISLFYNKIVQVENSCFNAGVTCALDATNLLKNSRELCNIGYATAINGVRDGAILPVFCVPHHADMFKTYSIKSKWGVHSFSFVARKSFKEATDGI